MKRLTIFLLTFFCAAPTAAYGGEKGEVKSCGAIAGFIAGEDEPHGGPSQPYRLQDLNCAAASGVPERAALALTRSNWNPALKRWEFVLRCVESSDCVPFLVWTDGEAKKSIADLQSLPAQESVTIRIVLVRAGQSAMLTWDQGGIRVVLPVTCLDAGSLGQTVRVRLMSGRKIMRAEVVGAAAVRLNL